MKRIILLSISAMLISIVTFAQMRSIPGEVTEAFKEKFPDAKLVSWKDNLANFEADFTDNGYTYEVKFNSKGEWLETAKKVEFKELNEDIKDGFQKSKYNEWEVRGVKEITAKDKELVYRILIRKSGVEKKYLFYNKSGQLKKEALAL